MLSLPLFIQRKLPTTALKFLLAPLPSSYLTSQILYLVNLNPHHFRPPSILPVSHRPRTSLPKKKKKKKKKKRYNPSQSESWFYFFADLKWSTILRSATYSIPSCLWSYSQEHRQAVQHQNLWAWPSSNLFLQSMSWRSSSLHYKRVVNNSLLSGSFLESFKSAIVRHLLKKPSLDPENLGNYHPVSNLPFLPNTSEKVVLAQLLEHLRINKLLYYLRSAYRSSHFKARKLHC